MKIEKIKTNNNSNKKNIKTIKIQKRIRSNLKIINKNRKISKIK